jgi:polar amino acid transport system permease protein
MTRREPGASALPLARLPDAPTVPGANAVDTGSRAHVAGLRARPRPRLLRQVVTVLIVAAAAAAAASFGTRKTLDWDVIGTYLFNHQVLRGVVETIEITALSLLLGWASGLIIAMLRLSGARALQVLSGIWVWFFRAVPVLVVLIVVNNIALLYPRVGLGIPWGPQLTSIGTTHLVTPFFAAVIAFGANEGAYDSEIFRAAIMSVPRGQHEAATALGMRSGLAFRRVILPQAMRFAVPPLANNAINMLKGTSLVSFIGAADLLYTVQTIYAQNYEIIPLLMVACIWYLVLVTIMTGIQTLAERKFDPRRPGSSRTSRLFRGGTDHE